MAKIKGWLQQEYSTGIILFIAALLALVAANSPLRLWYDALLTTPLSISVGDQGIDKPLLLWINDGLMAIFFAFVALEVKRELCEGELRSVKKIALPGAAAVGGMLVPAAVYLAATFGDASAMRGWAIPAATDIAFALGVLALLGNRVPASLKVFLLTLAVIDDLGAIAIIALFYTSSISTTALFGSLAALVALICMNRSGVKSAAAYVLVGVVAWVFVLKSGVHATLAGVAVGFAIPFAGKDGGPSLVKALEHNLKPWVSFFILPAFAFANAGLALGNISLADLLSPVPLAIGLGLVVGKQVGVFGFAYLAVKLGIARLPENTRWAHIYGVAWLTGIGFTMSLFIASLAFPENTLGKVADYRLGILLGSTIAALGGYAILRLLAAQNCEDKESTPQQQYAVARADYS